MQADTEREILDQDTAHPSVTLRNMEDAKKKTLQMVHTSSFTSDVLINDSLAHWYPNPLNGTHNDSQSITVGLFNLI